MLTTLSPYPRSKTIKGIRWLSEPVRYPNLDGDTWSPAWAPGGDLISSADDTLGFDQSINSNLAIYCIQGDAPDHKISLVNPMKEYGARAEHEGWASWKANGMVSVDGTLYLSVSQHRYWRSDLIQQAYDATIIKSEDGGKTWSAKPKLGEAMFPDNYFATPWFVKFGQDYCGAPDEYVYAVSNNGSWNNGDFMMLGRVHRSRIGNLDPNDWQFFAGTDDDGKPRWNDYLVKLKKKPKPSDDNGDHPDLLSTPASIFKHRLKVGMTGMQYVPAIDRYIMGQWFFPELDTEGFGRTSLILLEAPNMWGPWSWFHHEPCWNHVYYCPEFPAKWFEDGGRKMWITASGAFFGNPRPDYTFIAQQLELIM